jgi:hypothetical protein
MSSALSALVLLLLCRVQKNSANNLLPAFCWRQGHAARQAGGLHGRSRGGKDFSANYRIGFRLIPLRSSMDSLFENVLTASDNESFCMIQNDRIS